jgi:hypothetical protein
MWASCTDEPEADLQPASLPPLEGEPSQLQARKLNIRRGDLRGGGQAPQSRSPTIRVTHVVHVRAYTSHTELISHDNRESHQASKNAPRASATYEPAAPLPPPPGLRRQRMPQGRPDRGTPRDRARIPTS